MMIYWFLFIFIWIVGLFLFFANHTLRLFSYAIFIFIFIFIFYLLLNYNKSILWYQIIFLFFNLVALQISYIIGIDGVSLLFIILCVFLLMYCLLSYWFVKYKVNLYIFTLLFSLWLLLNIFTSLDFFFFYVYFEGVVIPMFFLIVFEVSEHERFMHHISSLFIPY